MTWFDFAALAAAFVLGALCPSAYEEWKTERRKRREQNANWWDRPQPPTAT